MTFDGVVNLLNQPIGLAAAGFVFTSVFGSFITNRIQNSKLENDRKKEIISRITESITKLFANIQSVEAFHGRKGDAADENHVKNMNDSYKNFVVESEVISNLILAYWLDYSLRDDWKKLCAAVTDFYAITGTYEGEFLEMRITNLSGYVEQSDVNWDRIAEYKDKTLPASQLHTYMFEWEKLRDHLTAQTGDISHRIVRRGSLYLALRSMFGRRTTTWEVKR